MNILLVGYLDRNFGDDMMLKIVCHYLKNHSLFMESSRGELLLPFVNIKNLQILKNDENINIDLVLRVTGSGFMITNKVGIYYSLLRFLQLNKLSKKSQMAIIGCNVGPYKNKIAEALSILDMKQYKLITVREKFSYNFIKKHIPKKPVCCFPDIVFGMPNQWIPQNSGEDNLGICAYRRSVADNLSFYKNMATIADNYIAKTGKNVLIFSFDIENENDTAAALTIKQLCKNHSKVEIVPHIDDGDYIIKNMARCGKFVAVRFHSAIMALKMGIPFVPIIYSDKVNRMLDDLCYTETRHAIDSIDTDKILKQLYVAKPFELPKIVCEQALQHIKIIERELL